MADPTAAVFVVVGLVIVFLLLPARWDPAIRIKEWFDRHEGGVLPGCFASRPGPQQQAENGCHECPHTKWGKEAGDDIHAQLSKGDRPR